MANEQRLIKFYESIKGALAEKGFEVSTTYRSFVIKDRDGNEVGQCNSIDGLNSWLEAFNYAHPK